MSEHRVRSELGNWAPIPEWVARKLSGEPQALMLYVCLALRADRSTLECFPGIKTLAKDMGCSEATVKRSIKRLVECGALEVSHQKRGGEYTSNLYTVLQVDRSMVGSPVRPPGSKRDPLTRTICQDGSIKRGRKSKKVATANLDLNHYAVVFQRNTEVQPDLDLLGEKLKSSYRHWSEEEPEPEPSREDTETGEVL